MSSLLFCISRICLRLSPLILLLHAKIFAQLMWSLSLSSNLQYKFSKPRPLNYWNSGECRYTPHPMSIFASQHKNSLNGLFPIVRQNSAFSHFKQPSSTERGLEKKGGWGSGGGGGERRTLEKPTELHNSHPCVKRKTENGFRWQECEPQRSQASQAPSIPSHTPYCKDKSTLG